LNYINTLDRRPFIHKALQLLVKRKSAFGVHQRMMKYEHKTEMPGSVVASDDTHPPERTVLISIEWPIMLLFEQLL
jgi:hypothetical protein